jgi:Ca2+-dependent lipid-binding protein
MKIELSLHATNLKNVAGILKGTSDPFCTVTKIGDNAAGESKSSMVLGKSEVIQNNLNPDWAHVFVVDDYHQHQPPPMKIAVSIFDKVPNGNDISMGSVIFDIGTVLASRGTYEKKKEREPKTRELQ